MRRLFVILFILFCLLIFINIDYFIFKVLITAGYAYTDTLDTIYIDNLSKENFKSYFWDFDRAVISVFTEKIRQTDGDNYTYLYTPQSYSESKSMTRAVAASETIKELSSDTVYIKLPNISSYTRSYFIDNKKTLAEYKNIIIDLRSNYGGMLSDYYKISEMFLDKGAVIGYEIIRPQILTREVKSKSKPYFNFEKIIILQNKETASSAEGLIMSLKENLNNVTLIGERTFGKGIGQATIPLKAGYAVKATVIKLETPLGNSIHNIGIKPDIEYIGGDIIEAALGIAVGE